MSGLDEVEVLVFHWSFLVQLVFSTDSNSNLLHSEKPNLERELAGKESFSASQEADQVRYGGEHLTSVTVRTFYVQARL